MSQIFRGAAGPSGVRTEDSGLSGFRLVVRADLKQSLKYRKN